MSVMDTLVAENKFIEAKEALVTFDRKLSDDDFSNPSEQVAEHFLGVDLPAVALHYVQSYAGLDDFIVGLRLQLVKKGSLSARQLRAALNVLRAEVMKDQSKMVRKASDVRVIPVIEPGAAATVVEEPTKKVGPTPTDGPERCYTCGAGFDTVRDVMAHKAAGHEEIKVLKDVDETFLDISSIPDGRYAAVDPTLKGRFIYFSIKTLTKRQYRSKKYRYGKFHVGMEYVEAGTIEVRTWSQDAKKLVGEQRAAAERNPDGTFRYVEGYRGEHTQQLIEIMSAPGPSFWARLFSIDNVRCSFCAKTLTDDYSKAVGMGPECEKKYGLDYFDKFQRGVTVVDPEDGDDDEE